MKTDFSKKTALRQSAIKELANEVAKIVPLNGKKNPNVGKHDKEVSNQRSASMRELREPPKLVPCCPINVPILHLEGAKGPQVAAASHTPSFTDGQCIQASNRHFPSDLEGASDSESQGTSQQFEGFLGRNQDWARRRQNRLELKRWQQATAYKTKCRGNKAKIISDFLKREEEWEAARQDRLETKWEAQFQQPEYLQFEWEPQEKEVLISDFLEREEEWARSRLLRLDQSWQEQDGEFLEGVSLPWEELNEISTRLHEHARVRHEEMQHKRKEYEREAMEECTFRPAITHMPMHIDHRSNAPRRETLDKEARTRRERRRQAVESRQKELQDIDAAECPFAPQLTATCHHPAARIKKQCMSHQPEEYSFTPQICPKSERILQRSASHDVLPAHVRLFCPHHQPVKRAQWRPKPRCADKHLENAEKLLATPSLSCLLSGSRPSWMPKHGLNSVQYDNSFADVLSVAGATTSRT